MRAQRRRDFGVQRAPARSIIGLGPFGIDDASAICANGWLAVLTPEEWQQIRDMHFIQGLTIKAIARRTHRARNTVRMAVRSTEPPRYVRKLRALAPESAAHPIPLDVIDLRGEGSNPGATARRDEQNSPSADAGRP